MARVGRLSGALLVQTEEAGRPVWFLVGDTKRPCDWAAEGFAPPGERDVRAVRYLRLSVTGAPRLQGAVFSLPLSGEEAARLVAERLLVARNGSVSERLWRLLFGVDDLEDAPAETELDARWLGELPARIWDVVREAVLKCT